MASIELHCSVCPSKPRFSDQSHLLTHIGSKGHLSHYFKVQVRAQQDVESRAQLRRYNDWFEKNNIQELLSQRLKAKETKAAPRQAPATKRPQPKKRTSRKKRPDPEEKSEYDLQAGPFIDPSLEDHKLLPTPNALLSGMGQSGYGTDISLGRPAPVAQMQPSEVQNATELLTAEEELELLQTPSRQEAIDSLCCLNAPEGHFLTPIEDSTQPDPSPLRLQPSPSPSDHAVSVATSSAAASKYTKDYAPGDSAALKGVVWPGMDLFDTADIDARRKRNQKKDDSALHKMEVESLGFEPTEVIYFYPSWDLKKARFISGEVESSPPPELTPERSAPSCRETRKPLAELDPNVHRGKRAKTKSNKVAAPKEIDPVYDGFEPDFGLQIGNGRKRGRPFQVFRDSPTETKPKDSYESNISMVEDPIFPHEAEIRHHASQYTSHIHQPQPMSSGSFPILNGHDLFDQPVVSPSVRDSNIFRLEQTKQVESHELQFPHGLPIILDSPQRYFTAGAGEVQFRSSMPPYVDMAIAYGLHHGLNPFHANRLGSDTLGNFLSHGVTPHAYQDPPIELRQPPRYNLQRRSPTSDGNSSDATIDQGISETNQFLDP